jgi:mono/diheme cytochrome c family protein
MSVVKSLRNVCKASVMVGLLAFGIAPTWAQAEQPAEKKEKQPHDYAELLKAPGKARQRQNPLQADGDAVAAGNKLFEQHCEECHGRAGAGGKKGPRLSAPEVQEATPGSLFWLLTNGVVRRGMPVWSKLPEAQRWQLVRYLQTLKIDPNTDPATTTAK